MNRREKKKKSTFTKRMSRKIYKPFRIFFILYNYIHILYDTIIFYIIFRLKYTHIFLLLIYNCSIH